MMKKSLKGFLCSLIVDVPIWNEYYNLYFNGYLLDNSKRPYEEQLQNA